nr:mechanosensitive ion channel family protein [Pseudomarimonas arenosa]
MAAVGVGAVLIRLAVHGVFRGILPLLRFSPARIVEDLVTTVLAAAWLLVWLHVVGVDLGSLVTTSAVITAVVAFAMQDTLGNVLGGVVLQIDDSLRVGDWVKFDDINGQVVDIRWRHTAIETRNRETVVVPNGWLVKNRFTVIGSRRDPQPVWRRWVWFNVMLDAPPSRVCEVLEESVRQASIEHVAETPAPSAVLMDIGQGYARYALRFWLSEPRVDDPSDSEVRMHALAALARNGMRLAVVQEERVVIKENEARRAHMQAHDRSKRLAALASVELFASLSAEERDALAESLVHTPFVHGDTITRQGSVAHWLYMIISGEADVWAENEGLRTRVATLKAGSVVGEMGLMTGEPRRATVTARTDVECYRLDKDALRELLASRKDIAEEMSKVIAKRQDELDSARASAPSGKSKSGAPDDIRSRILNFFGLDRG